MKSCPIILLLCLFVLPIQVEAQQLRAIQELSAQQAEPNWAKELRAKFRDQEQWKQVIVQYRDDFQTANGLGQETFGLLAARQELESQGIEVIRGMRATNAVRVRIQERDIETLLNDPNITGVLVDREYKQKATPSLQRRKLFSAKDNMGIEELYAQGYTGEGQVVVILDDGIYADHEVFGGGKIVRQACFSSSDADNGRSSLCRNGEDSQISVNAASYCPSRLDVCVHGTFVANIAAGDDPGDVLEKDGVAYGADIIAVQVFSEFENQADEEKVCEEDEGSTCLRSSSLDQFEAIDWILSIADEYNIAAVNMSFGDNEENFEYCSDSPYNDIIEDLRDLEILATVAAGNEGYVGAVTEPGCVEPAITVSGKSEYSNSPIESQNHAEMVDFLAPGSNIVAAGRAPGDYVITSGSSASTPFVAGAIALLRSVDPNATADQIEYALKASGDKITKPNWDWETPTIQAAAAAQRLDETVIPNGKHLVSVFSSGDPSGTLSFLRFYNIGGYAEDVRVTFVDDEAEDILDTFETNIPRNASVQFEMDDIEADLGINTRGRSTYTAIVNSSFSGYVQHVIWNPGGASLTNVTSCLGGVSSNQTRLSNIHTDRVASGYPSYIFIHNGGYDVDSAQLDVYESATGDSIGAVSVSDIAPATTVVIEALDILDEIGYSPGEDDFHFNLALRSGFDGSIAHIVNNEGAGVLTNMSDKCWID